MAYQITSFSTSPFTNSRIYSILCDTDSDLPATVDGYSVSQGWTAKTVDGKSYIANSSGTWVLQPTGISLDLNGYYTSAETDTLLAGKQSNLSTAQLAATNSGITAADVVKIEMPASDLSDSILDKNYNCRVVGYANTVGGKGGWCYVDTVIVNSTASRRIQKAYFSDGTIKSRFYGEGGVESWGNWT